jgi:hypothetical protein
MAVLVELRTLKHKTRIPIEQGWHLHGVMDETGFLEPGQVYVPVNKDGITRPIVQTEVLISRAPALHPGDVQRVDAIDVPNGSPLRRLHNCVGTYFRRPSPHFNILRSVTHLNVLSSDLC